MQACISTTTEMDTPLTQEFVDLKGNARLMMACWVQAETPMPGVTGTRRHRGIQPPPLLHKLYLVNRKAFIL